VDVFPAQGRLFDISGEIAVDRRSGFCGPIKLTLAGDTGRQTIEVDRSFRFDPVAPGPYEIYGEGPCTIPPSPPQCPQLVSYLKLPVEEDHKTLRVAPTCVSPTNFLYTSDTGSRVTDTRRLALQARRKDMAGAMGAVDLGNGPRSALLAAGRWELLLQTPGDSAVVGFSDSGTRSLERPDGWHEILSVPASFATEQFVVSASPGSLRGIVTGDSHENVVGVPVYLEGYDTGLGKRVTDLRTVLTDTNGAYQFAGLTPGTYRVLATFEYQSPDSFTMGASRATPVTIEKGNSRAQDLDLFVLR
jgi:hypothetical protein